MNLLKVLVVLFAINLVFQFLTIYSNFEVEKQIQIICEKAYFEGQKDAITGDVRIKYDENKKCWLIVRSFWDSNKSTILDVSNLN